MFAVWDYSNVIDYLFRKSDAFKEQKKEKESDNTTYISAHTFIKKILLYKMQQPELSQKQIFRRLKKKNITVVFPGNFYYDSKQDILSMQDILQSQIQFSYLNLYDRIFMSKDFDQSNNFKEYQNFLANNEFFLNLLSQNLKEKLSKQCIKQGIEYIESPSLPQFQMIFLNRINSNNKLEDTPIILAFADKSQKIIWKQNKKKIFVYDQKNFAKQMEIRANKLQQILFWGLLIYCSSKIFTSQSIFKKVVSRSSSDINKGYEKELQIISNQVKVILKFIDKKESLEINLDVLNFFSELEFVNKMKIQKFFNFFTNCNIIYDPYVGSNRFYIFQNDVDSKQLQQNNYLNQLGQYLKFNGFLPQNYSCLSHKYQKFFILIQNKFYFESNELNYLQNGGFKKIIKNILRNMIFIICQNIPKKIIIKQYYGQQFYNRLKTSEIPFTNQFYINQKNFGFYESLQNFRQICKNKNVISKQQNCCTKIQLLNLSYLYFFETLGFIDTEKKTINSEGKFLIKLGKLGYFQFGILVLDFVKNDFFNNKSFIKIEDFTSQKADQQRKKYQMISSHDYFLYMGETFSEVILKLIELMPQIMAKNSDRCHRDIWTMLQQGSLRSNIKQQEFYRIAFYELFFNAMDYYEHNRDNIVKFDQCQCLLMSRMIEIRKNINFITTIYILTSIDQFSHNIEDVSSEKINCVVNFINQQYNALLKSFFLNLIHSQNKTFDEKTKQLINQIPFSSYQQGTKAPLVKKLFTFLHSYETIKEIFPLAEERMRKLIITTLNQIQQDNCFFETHTDIIQVLIKSFERSGIHKTKNDFYQKLQNNLQFLTESKKIINKILNFQIIQPLQKPNNLLLIFSLTID